MNQNTRQMWIGVGAIVAVVIGTTWGCQAHKRMVAMQLASVEAALAVDNARQASQIARSARELDRLSAEQRVTVAEQRASLDQLADQLATDIERGDDGVTPETLKTSAQALNTRTDKVLAVFGRRLEPADPFESE